jgi:hypothetical protein
MRSLITLNNNNYSLSSNCFVSYSYKHIGISLTRSVVRFHQLYLSIVDLFVSLWNYLSVY